MPPAAPCLHYGHTPLPMYKVLCFRWACQFCVYCAASALSRMISRFSAFFSCAAVAKLKLPKRRHGLHEVFPGSSSAKRLSVTQRTHPFTPGWH